MLVIFQSPNVSSIHVFTIWSAISETSHRTPMDSWTNNENVGSMVGRPLV